MIKLIIGIGNPGEKYANTYHNLGANLIDYLSEDDRRFESSRLFAFKKIPMAGGSVVLIKTKTFMNESGEAAHEAMRYFKAKPNEIILAHDDSDIELGHFKLAFGRGAAGHNGISSVIRSIRTQDFWRLRIGIRTSPKTGVAKKRLKAGDFVLRKISKKDETQFASVFQRLKESVIEKVVFTPDVISPVSGS